MLEVLTFILGLLLGIFFENKKNQLELKSYPEDVE